MLGLNLGRPRMSDLERYRHLFGFSADGVVHELDPRGNITPINASGCDASCVADPAAAPGRPLASFWPAATGTRGCASACSSRTSANSLAQVYRVARPAGGFADVESAPGTTMAMAFPRVQVPAAD